ncbi:hypothetical protein R5R35_007801 [Gryllus longicercus]|uniref:Uncharacterized protein n=1 Tax=Gryllus longicercus TaxID=2509291 RepID=A0AAN9W9L0_9ORTH
MTLKHFIFTEVHSYQCNLWRWVVLRMSRKSSSRPRPRPSSPCPCRHTRETIANTLRLKYCTKVNLKRSGFLDLQKSTFKSHIRFKALPRRLVSSGVIIK